MRDLAGGKIRIVEPQRDETSSPGVKVGAARRAQTARFRYLDAVPLCSDRQRNEIVNVVDGEPARLGRRSSCAMPICSSPRPRLNRCWRSNRQIRLRE